MLQPGQSTESASIAELIPANYFEALDLKAIFGRQAPLEVDLGCGDGAHLAEIALDNPECDFLGIERLQGRIRKANGRIGRLGLTNARVFRIESSYAIQYLLPAKSVSVFHLMFPDPWPKRRHRCRRVVTEDFLASIHRALATDGLLRVATDQVDYFLEIERLAGASQLFVRMADQEVPGAASTFEKRFNKENIEIHYLTLRKT